MDGLIIIALVAWTLFRFIGRARRRGGQEQQQRNPAGPGQPGPAQGAGPHSRSREAAIEEQRRRRAAYEADLAELRPGSFGAEQAAQGAGRGEYGAYPLQQAESGSYRQPGPAADNRRMDIGPAGRMRPYAERAEDIPPYRRKPERAEDIPPYRRAAETVSPDQLRQHTARPAPVAPSVTPHNVPVMPSVAPHNVPVAPSVAPHNVPVAPSVAPHNVPVMPSVAPHNVPVAPSVAPRVSPAYVRAAAELAASAPTSLGQAAFSREMIMRGLIMAEILAPPLAKRRGNSLSLRRLG